MRNSDELGGACRPCPRRCPSSIRQWSIHGPNFGCGRAVRPQSRTARQDHAALGRAATSGPRRRHQLNLRSRGRSHRRGHESRGFHYARNGGPRRRSACASRRDEGDQRDLTSAAGTDMAVHARGGGGCRGVSGDLRCPTSARGGSHIRECSRRCHSSPQLGALQRKRLPATILPRPCSPALSARWRFATS